MGPVISRVLISHPIFCISHR